MTCATCGKGMTTEVFEGHQSLSVEIDYCLDCQAFWFDHFENLQLAPRATLKLFRLIGEASEKARPRPWPDGACPRCGIRLLKTHDLQRNTPFVYWRCARRHGRQISFYDFLREKDFIRPLPPEQLEELRRQLASINCSNCGAPIDLARDSVCSHCGSPLSILDTSQAGKLIAHLQNADAPVSEPMAKLAALLPHAPQAPDLIGEGLRSLIALLMKRV
ncbi:MAG: zinc ribbon domain-containing protein [Vicinamibacterales bacterium]